MANKNKYRVQGTGNRQQGKDINAWPKRELFLLEPKTLFVIIIVSVLTLLVSFLGDRGVKFLTSVISPIPAHAPFDGTTSPVKQIPNWIKLTETERKTNYSGIPEAKIISLPAYVPAHLTIPISTLKWNNAEDDAIRNEEITYSVPYLGSYRLDGVEGAGSHPAVDVKIPEGTPIYAIANGTVVKTVTGYGGGFGNHIVIQHNGVPSLDDPNAKMTVYSSYNHLSAISINLYDVVTKGQLIGYSGATGTATTPHLHFQIDNDNPAWHPYWPFTGAEQKAAGYSFFDAINNGLGKGNAIANTVNPMQYVQKYAGSQALVASAIPELTQALAAVTDGYDDLSFTIQILNTPPFEGGSEIKFSVQAFDSNGNLVNNPTFNDEIKFSLLNGNGQLNRDVLSATNLRTGIANLISMEGAKVGKEKLLLRFRDHEFSSPEFDVVEPSPPPAPEPTVTEQPASPVATTIPEVIIPPVVEPITVVQPPVVIPPSVILPFSDIPEGSKYFQILKELKEAGIAKGYGDGTFHPERDVSRAEAVTFILRAISQELKDKINITFPDVKLDQWYTKPVSTAVDLGFIQGYPDGYFRPEAKVNLAEFLKMLFIAAKMDIDPQILITLPTGVASSDWFAPYFQEAIRKNILDLQNNTTDPAKSLNRGDIADILYRLRKVEIESSNS